MSKKSPTKPKQSKKDAPAPNAATVAVDAITGDDITIAGVTFTIPTQDDLPRSVRRTIRQTQVKYALPGGNDRSRGRPDLYGMAFEIGEIVLQHYGVPVNLDDDSLSVEEADAQDALITILGLRVLQPATDESDGEADAPKDSEAASD